MSFLDFFRPRWRHSDIEVRSEAVRQLGADDLPLLAKIVRQDVDARVRKIALKKIDDPALLGELAANDPDETLRKAAAEKASELLIATAVKGADPAQSLAALDQIKGDRAIADVAKRAGDPDVRRKAVDRISDGHALADVARNAADAEIRTRAVGRIDDPAQLREVAIHDPVKEVGLAALARVSDGDALELILKRAKSKAVKAAARERLTPGAGDTPTAPARPSSRTARPKTVEVTPEAKRRALLAQACHLAEEAARQSELETAEAELAKARTALGEIGGLSADDEHRLRFDRAAARIVSRRQEHDRLHHLHVEEAEADARRAAAEAERIQRESEERAAREAARTDEEKAEAAAKEVAREAARIEREKREAEKAAQQARRDAEKAVEKERREAEEAQNLSRLVEVCVSLEALAGSDDAKQTEAALKTAEAAFQSGGHLPRAEAEKARERFQAARNKLVIRLQELREAENWRRWANVPRLDGLCVKVEALAKDEALDAKEKARQLKALQAEWKTVGPAPREKSEALWARFKAAGDLVYGKSQETLAVSDEERAANLKKKEELCVQVEALAVASEGDKTAAWTGVEWKDTAEKFKKLQEEWKAIGAVPKDDTDAIWKRFRTPCDVFFERRKAQLGQLDGERAANLKKLEDLCARAEALSGAAEFKETGEKIKALQAEWKEVGNAGRRESEAAWKRFREACDKFFARRKEHFDQLDSERAANLKKKEAMCVEVEALEAPVDEHAAGELIRKYMADWKKIGPAPREQADSVWERFRKACDSVRDKARGEEPEPEGAVVEQAQASGPAPKFENKLPLADIAAEWDRLADDEEEKKD